MAFSLKVAKKITTFAAFSFFESVFSLFYSFERNKQVGFFKNKFVWILKVMAVLFLQKWNVSDLYRNFCIFANSLNFSYFDRSETKIGIGRLFIKTSNFNLRLFFLNCRPNIENWNFPLQACSMSCSIRQHQCFFKNNVFWDIERFQCKSELDCFHKIHSYKKNLLPI